MPKEAKSSKGAGRGKPSKPYPDFPLFAHQRGYWAKKIKGRTHYFGLVSDPDVALAKYLDQRDDLQAGRTPRTPGDGLTVRDLVNRFLTAKRQQADGGELTERSFADYHAMCQHVITAFGLTRLVTDLASDDFEQLRAVFSKRWGPVRLGNEVQRVRVLFKYALDSGLIDRVVRYGPTFKRPSRKVLRKLRASKGPKMFEAKDLRRLLDIAPPHLKAMILLGLNCGYGNADVATLPLAALDLKGGWVQYPRPKTGIDRSCPLWKETTVAVKAAIEARPMPKSEAHADLVFITKYGSAWHKDTSDNPISQEFRKLLEELGVHRAGLGFYALRHTFETVGGEARDQPAVDHIMGHAREDMASVYRERISDERLKAVTDHVRAWLWPKGRKAK